MFAIGVKSRLGCQGSLLSTGSVACELVVTSSVVPSASDRISSFTARAPPAPGLDSIRTGRLICSLTFWPTSRDTTSTPPPGANGINRRIGLLGSGPSASAGCASMPNAAMAASRSPTIGCMVGPPFLLHAVGGAVALAAASARVVALSPDGKEPIMVSRPTRRDRTKHRADEKQEEAMSRKRPEDLRSHRWLGATDMRSFGHRSRLRQIGYDAEDWTGKPVIGIVNTWSEINPCHAHLRSRAENVKRGVLQAGGFPIELPALSLSETFVKPSTMMYRNMLAMETEELLRSHPIDGAVLMGGCDKTTPGLV